MNTQTRTAATLVALFACAGAHAQLLGGSLGGSAGGAFNGSLSGPGGLEGSAIGRGTLSGAGQLDTVATDRLRERATGTASRVKERSQETAGTVRDRTRDNASHLTHQGVNVATDATADVSARTKGGIDSASTTSQSVTVPNAQATQPAPQASPVAIADKSSNAVAGPAAVEGAVTGSGSSRGTNASASGSAKVSR